MIKQKKLFCYMYLFFVNSYVPNLTTCYVPNLTQNVPNLTGYPNVPKIEESSHLLKTKDISKLDDYPRKFLFLFITAQYFRTAEMRENIQNTAEQAINKLAETSGIKIPPGFTNIYTP